MHWTRLTPDPAAVTALCADARLSPIMARLLALRGIAGAAEARDFLSPSSGQLHSPDLMLGMREAVERLGSAIENHEPMLIYGDYDVDGTTAIVILKTAIELCGGSADFHVPHRIKEGYGMKDDVIERAAAAGVKLVISVDTGIRAFHAAETARRVGVDLIVTDHHLPETGEGVPAALAVLNPSQRGCEYPCKALCGAGVAFKVAQALLAKFKQPADQARLVPSFLKMVALATIADAVPLTGENRVMVKLGLEGLRRPVNLGLKALLEVSGLESGQALTATDVGFRLGPRINAAGRMDVAREVIELFTSRDQRRCREIAERLNLLNIERRNEEARILSEIEARLAGDPAGMEKCCMVLDGEGWHRGVVGIVASRMVEKTGRPSLVVATSGEEAHGSGRSISAFHLLEALESCRGLFTRFGGHAHAVGFTLPVAHIAELKLRLDEFARARLSPQDFLPELKIDAEIPLTAVTPELLEDLRQLEPFGNGNPRPVFTSQEVNLLLPPRVLQEKHIKLRVNQQRPQSKASYNYAAVGWRMAQKLEGQSWRAGDQLDLAFTVAVNSHPDFGGLELMLEDFKKSLVAVAAGSG